MDELRRLFYGRRQNWTALYWIESNNSLILLSNVFMIIYLNSNYTHHHRLSHSFPGWSALMSRSIWRQWASIKREECDVCYWGGAWSGLARVRALRHTVTRPWLWQVTKVTAGASVISMSDRHDVSVNQKTWTPRHRQPSEFVATASIISLLCTTAGGVTLVSLLEHC